MAAVEGGLELVQKKPEGAEDDVLVACIYDIDGGEYVMHKIWTKKEFMQRFGHQTTCCSEGAGEGEGACVFVCPVPISRCLIRLCSHTHREL